MVFVLALAALFTSFLSGVLGMAGGMLLMGIYVWLLPVSSAMVLHGATQLVSNGSRSFLLRSSIRWSVLRPYLYGSAVIVVFFALSGLALPTSWIYLLLGALPFFAMLSRRLVTLEIQSPVVAFICGVVVTGFQLLAGVSGPALDVFYQRSTLSPREVVATKAMTQTIGHALKLLYYGALSSAPSGDVSWFQYALVLSAAYLGTNIGKSLLLRLDAKLFQRLTSWVLVAIGVVYLYQGLVSL